MPLSLNEIRSRALKFSNEWALESSEDAEAKTFWNEFFEVFGFSRKKVATFEHPVHKADGRTGYIDLLWKGVVLVEHKSKGKSLDKAYTQARDYYVSLNLKESDLPRYIVVSDFANFRLYDLEEDKHFEFKLSELSDNIHLFGFISGYERKNFGKEDVVNVRAAERMGQLHDALKASGYEGHPLEVLLVRVLFCLFAEDTGIFEKSLFREYVEQRTSEDGADLGLHLGKLFQVLNTPGKKRPATLDEQQARFPYVNGRLFAESLPMADFNSTMRESLLECCALDWGGISPAIFGALFQSVMDQNARRNLGAHYTTETNILKAIRPLFVEELEDELEAIRSIKGPQRKSKLLGYQTKLRHIRIFDPACGCGNFLVIAYRELRRLEMEAMLSLRSDGYKALSVEAFSIVNVDQCYGIELEEFPAQIAQVALWLMDHHMNRELSNVFGEYYARLPLDKAAVIINANALRVAWEDIIRPESLSFIVGNPPFKGKKEQDETQKAELMEVFSGIRSAGVLDYVSCWYRKAVDYMQNNRNIKTAFVSTNSITQGEQVGVLWPDLIARGVSIGFAHRTFQWMSEARGKATVQCVIIGFQIDFSAKPQRKVLYDYDTPNGEPHAVEVRNISPYLTDTPNIFINNRSSPLSREAPQISYGSMPIDKKHLTLSPSDVETIIGECPELSGYIKRYIGGDEFLHSVDRYCLWLVGCPPEILRRSPTALSRVESVRAFRNSSGRPATVALAATPTLFGENRQPAVPYLFIPKVSSEHRRYLPMGFCPPDVIASGSGLIVSGAGLYQFGILQSEMHLVWLSEVGGRLESRYQYSAGIVYNNFPWPNVTRISKEAIEGAAQAVLDARTQYADSSLADLYDSRAMPAELVKAHQKLDQVVDKAYDGRRKFKSSGERLSYLFVLYQGLVAAS